MSARIFKPAKTAMQSGRRKTHHWRFEYDPDQPLGVDPLMGWTANTDMRRQISLDFPTKEDAIAYAERHGIPYRVYEEHKVSDKKLAYSDNFRPNRRIPWTH